MKTFSRKFKFSSLEERKSYVAEGYNWCREAGVFNTQRECANLLNMSEGAISKALKGDERALSDSFIFKFNQLILNHSAVDEFATRAIQENSSSNNTPSIPIIPVEAMAGSLGEFSSTILTGSCEMMTSPIRGVDFAIKVNGESMSPDYPNGSVVLVKKINASIFIEWGKVYVLDTPNGAIIKQILRGSQEDEVLCRSINSEYQEFSVKRADVLGWYKVLRVLCA